MLDHRKFLLWILCVAAGIGVIKILQRERRAQPDVVVATVSTPPALAPDGPLVSRVIDGDTLDCIVDGNVERIRLYGIDAPEGNQSFGAESTEHLRQLVSGKHCRIEVTGKDRYGRSIAKLWNESGYMNQTMVRDGAAWWYRKYAPSDAGLSAAEDAARSERKGLWMEAQPIAPWDFR